MKKAIKMLTVSILYCIMAAMFICPSVNAKSSDDNFGYKDWPGKENTIKSDIQVSIAPFDEYGLKSKTLKSQFMYFNLPASKDDTENHGRLVMEIYPTVEKAQLALLDNLYGFESNATRPPMLTEKDFPFGDVAFGWLNGDTIIGLLPAGRHVWYVKNNIFIVIEGIPSTVDNLAAKIDSIIQVAPVWSSGDIAPTFVFSKEFVDFFSEDPVSSTQWHEFLGKSLLLTQNYPNPFTENTIINCFIPDNTTDARLLVFDLRGTLVKTFKIVARNQTSVTISGAKLHAGMYIYSLVIDNREIDSKRMILTD